MLLAFVAVSFTGHKGGALTHGEQYLDEVYGLFLPSEKSENDTTEMVRKRFTEIDSALVYEDMVKPLLEENCVACHGAKKQNGGLRMDSISTILKASNSGQMCISGSAQKSELIHRMELDVSNIPRMLPETDPIPES
jgi:cytochrome c